MNKQLRSILGRGKKSVDTSWSSFLHTYLLVPGRYSLGAASRQASPCRRRTCSTCRCCSACGRISRHAATYSPSRSAVRVLSSDSPLERPRACPLHQPSRHQAGAYSVGGPCGSRDGWLTRRGCSRQSEAVRTGYVALINCSRAVRACCCVPWWADDFLLNCLESGFPVRPLFTSVSSLEDCPWLPGSTALMDSPWCPTLLHAFL